MGQFLFPHVAKTVSREYTKWVIWPYMDLLVIVVELIAYPVDSATTFQSDI